MVNKTAWLIFIRAKSKRLPNKCYLKLKGKITLERLVNSAITERIQKSDIFLCTSNHYSCNDLVSIAGNIGINILRGPEDYPVQRFFSEEAFNKLLKYNLIVRICGDSPFYPFRITQKATNMFSPKEEDIFAITNVRKRNFPRGMSIEIYKKDYLFRLLKKEPKLQKIEHMSSIITGNSQAKFKIIDLETNINLLDKLPNKLTLDTLKDFQLFTKLVENNFDEEINSIIRSVKFTNQS